MIKPTRNCLLHVPWISMMSSALALSFVSQSGLAQDAGCKAVIAAQLHQVDVPYHSHSTMTLSPGKTQPSEQISTGKAIYILRAGKWVQSAITPAQLRDQLQDNVKNTKMACHAVRDETVDGVSVTLYSVHEENEGIVSDSQVWISKSTGLPVMLKMDVVESHYVYTDVVAPIAP